jgi:hypothetical protein
VHCGFLGGFGVEKNPLLRRGVMVWDYFFSDQHGPDEIKKER